MPVHLQGERIYIYIPAARLYEGLLRWNLKVSAARGNRIYIFGFMGLPCVYIYIKVLRSVYSCGFIVWADVFSSWLAARYRDLGKSSEAPVRVIYTEEWKVFEKRQDIPFNEAQAHLYNPKKFS